MPSLPAASALAGLPLSADACSVPDSPEEDDSPGLLLGGELAVGCPLLLAGGEELSADSCELLLGELSELLEGLLGGGLEGLLGGGLLLGLEGEEELGGEGGCGVVGLLALGQPLRIRHRPAAPAAFSARLIDIVVSPFRCVICPDYTFCCHRITIFEPRPETGAPQLAHKSVGDRFIIHQRLIDIVTHVGRGRLVQPAPINYPSAFAHPEF